MVNAQRQRKLQFTNDIPTPRKKSTTKLDDQHTTDDEQSELTNGPTNQRTNEPTNQRTNEPTNQRTNEPTNQRTNEPTKIVEDRRRRRFPFRHRRGV